jgi:hypothetical protein
VSKREKPIRVAEPVASGIGGRAKSKFGAYRPEHLDSVKPKNRADRRALKAVKRKAKMEGD